MTDTIERLEFWVDGDPVPQGSHRVFNNRIVDANPRLRLWRKTVTDVAATELAGRDGIHKDLGVYVLLDFYHPRGKTVRRVRPTVKPDLDKCVRSIFDSLTNARVWADDGQVVSVHAQQFYADDKPGVRVVVGALA